MISGEIHIDSHEYDYFFKNLFRKKTAKEKAARRRKRKLFWKKVGEGYQSVGGVDGVVKTAGSVKDFFDDEKGSKNAEDYEIKMGHTSEEKADEEEKERTKQEEKSKGIPIEVIVAGTITAVALGVWGYTAYRKKQLLKMNKQ